MLWSPQQEDALRAVKRWLDDPSGPQVFHLFGYAGTGKTTLAKHLAEGIDGDVLFGAFTGKAAHVLKSKGCHNAQTIHAMIYKARDKSHSLLRELEEQIKHLEKEDPTSPLLEKLYKDFAEERENATQPFFILNEASEVRDAELVIIDECSMVNDTMGADLMSFGTRILVLGDPAQLPPVMGAGFFTENVTPDVMLTEIHRQAQESGILRLATQVRLGSPIPVGCWGEDAIVYPQGTKLDPDQMLGFDQLIVGRNKTRRSSNAKLRRLHGLHDKYPEVGDRLVCLKNKHDLGLLNGAIFYVTDVEGVMDDKVHMSIRPEDEQASQEVIAHAQPFTGDDIPYYEINDAQQFDFGYALTCHKSQGSQWRSVVIFDESWCFKAERNRWLYTAITRASDRVAVVRM